MTLFRRLSACLLAAGCCVGLAGCDVDVEEEGRMPSVDVEPGKLPEVDVDGPEIDAKMKDTEVTVPDVDIDTEKTTVPVPDVDVTFPDDDDDDEE